jgi:hypothetical protein
MTTGYTTRTGGYGPERLNGIDTGVYFLCLSNKARMGLTIPSARSDEEL